MMTYREAKFEVICSNCKSVITYTSTDIQSKWLTKSRYITCPCCNSTLYIDYMQPKFIQNIEEKK